MNEGVELQEVQVKGAFQGQKKAINTQKNNLGITNVVSADQVGKFPDSNIGDALKRISGINVQYDQGEARFGQVRGTSADLSSVTINGNRVPSAEGDTRNVQLDLIPADMIQTIEVSKVVTPDMDGDAIGGSINLVTKNSPYKRTINATAGSGYNWISEKAQLNLGFTYGDRFFNDRLGMLLSASYQNVLPVLMILNSCGNKMKMAKYMSAIIRCASTLSPVNVKVIRRLLILISMKTIN